MNIKTILIIAFVALLFALIIIFNMLTGRTGGSTTSSTSPTPTLIQIQLNLEKKLSIISTSPIDAQKDISRDPVIIIRFTKPINEPDVLFSIHPLVPFRQTIVNDTLEVHFINSLSPGLLYTYIVKYPKLADSSRTYTFTTTGPAQQFLPDTRPEGLKEDEETFQKNTHPDVFLVNNTPYETSTFSISSLFVSKPTGHFAFTVLLGQDKEKGKKDFMDWLTSLGLSDKQITSLDITYK